ncbi:hypothetical protein [Desulforegula conservatrix]|uniref:hypothetical protein n=1 Tax=Desulforegula conservatrix TaxID=153026 RepID=UPI000404B008|nr:hypothetical protein [Desulforegula conservatrix]
MMEYLLFAIYIFLAYLIFQHVIGPILIYENEAAPFRYQFTLLDPESFMEDRNDVFRADHEKLLELGFRFVGSSKLARTNATMYFSLYSHDEKCIAATLVTGLSKLGEMNFLEITQVYSDKSILSVSNSPMISTYPAMKHKKAFRFPDIDDCGRLFELFELVRSRFSSNIEPLGFTIGKEFRAVENYLNEELRYLIENGYYSDSPENGEFKLTIKGAILFTWKNLWPWKNFVEVLERRAAIKAIS